MDRRSDWYDVLQALKRADAERKHAEVANMIVDGLTGIVYDSQKKVAATDAQGRPLKYDEGKVKLSLVPPFFTSELARVFEYGLTKYERDSWKGFALEDARELIDAAMRHVDQYRDGEYYDQESKLPHLMSAAWNLLIIHWHEMHNRSEITLLGTARED